MVKILKIKMKLMLCIVWFIFFEDFIVDVLIFKKNSEFCPILKKFVRLPYPPSIWPPGGAPESNLSSDMLVYWVKVIWAKDGGSGTQWGPAIIFSEKNSTSLNPMRLSHMLFHLFNALRKKMAFETGFFCWKCLCCCLPQPHCTS